MQVALWRALRTVFLIGRYDQELKDFIDRFNEQHKGQVTMLDFSNYTTSFGEMKDESLRKADLEQLQEFQKRKAEK